MAARRLRWSYVLAGLGLAIAGALLTLWLGLDGFLLHQARARADLLGETLGRKIQIGQLNATFAGGAGVRIEAVEVGPSEGEEEGLARLGRAEVKVDLWRVLRSGGAELPLRSVELSGLVVNVVRRLDGSTNVEQVVRRLRPTSGAKPSVPSLDTPSARAVRVDHAHLTGDLYFLDRTSPSRKALAIREVYLTLDDLRVGQPVTLALKAALLAPSPNLVAKLTSAPLPPTLVPTWERLALTLKPVDLTPLAPFLPATVGLGSGTLAADFWAQLGSAVPGGSGPTRVVGTARAKALQLGAGRTRKPVDVTLEADVTGDADRGDLRLDRFHLSAGVADLDGRGEVQGIFSRMPTAKGLEVLGRNLDPDLVRPYFAVLRDSLAGVTGPFSFWVKSAGEGAPPVFSMRLDLTQMQMTLPGHLTKAAGAPLTLQASVGAAAEATKVEAQLDLRGVDLRPGGVVDKAPGQPCALTFEGTLPGHGGERSELRVEAQSLGMALRGQELRGSARFERSPRKTHFTASLQSARVDLDTLLMPGSSKREGVAPSPPDNGAAGAGKPSQDGAWREVAGEVQVQIASARYRGVDLRNVSTQLRLVGDQLSAVRFTTETQGGIVDLDGSQVRVAAPEHPFTLKMKATGLDMAALLPRTLPRDLVTGRFSGEVAVLGAGSGISAVSHSLSGRIQGEVTDGAFRGGDVVALLAGQLAHSLPFTSRTLEDAKATSLGKSLPFSLQLSNGTARLKKPLEIVQERGSLRLDGAISLDGALDMTGTLALAPQAVRELTKNRVSLGAPLPIGFRLRGPVTAPSVTELDLGAAIETLVQQAATGNVATLKEKVKQGLRGLLGR